MLEPQDREELRLWREGHTSLIEAQLATVANQIHSLKDALHASAILSDNRVEIEKANALSLTTSLLAGINDRVALLKEALAFSIAATDSKAQTANDELERLLEANMEAISALANQRMESINAALSKVESQLAIAYSSAKDSLTSVDERSIMRHNAVNEAIRAVESSLIARITALQGMIDLRSEMNQVAILKAEQATERRFDSVNEFRSQLSDQTATFLTRTEIEAMINIVGDRATTLQVSSTNLELRMREEFSTSVHAADLKPINESIDKLRDWQSMNGGRSGALSSVMTVGIAMLAILVSLGGAIWHRDASGPNALAQAQGADLSAIMRELQSHGDTLNRLNAKQPPQ